MTIIGLHGRNDILWRDCDFEAIQLIQPSWLKMMSHTSPDVYRRLREVAPGVQFVTRLYDGSNFGVGYHPSPAEFCKRMVPVIESLLNFCHRFEVHNEPNHIARYEGWGKEREDANDFTGWFMLVSSVLRSHFGREIELGFPGLADCPPGNHNTYQWLEVCRPAIEQSDFLCCHSYWQSPPGGPRRQWMDGEFGLNFQFYHGLYKDKPIYITECGNSNCQNNYPLPEDEMSAQICEWLREVAKFDYIRAACPYLLSSPDPAWEGFAWVDKNGELRKICYDVAQLQKEFNDE